MGRYVTALSHIWHVYFPHPSLSSSADTDISPHFTVYALTAPPTRIATYRYVDQLGRHVETCFTLPRLVVERFFKQHNALKVHMP